MLVCVFCSPNNQHFLIHIHLNIQKHSKKISWFLFDRNMTQEFNRERERGRRKLKNAKNEGKKATCEETTKKWWSEALWNESYICCVSLLLWCATMKIDDRIRVKLVVSFFLFSCFNILSVAVVCGVFFALFSFQGALRLRTWILQACECSLKHTLSLSSSKW